MHQGREQIEQNHRRPEDTDSGDVPSTTGFRRLQDQQHERNDAEDDTETMCDGTGDFLFQGIAFCEQLFDRFLRLLLDRLLDFFFRNQSNTYFLKTKDYAFDYTPSCDSVPIERFCRFDDSRHLIVFSRLYKNPHRLGDVDVIYHFSMSGRSLNVDFVP